MIILILKSDMEAKYNKIGNDYNETRKADPYLVERLKFHLNIHKNRSYLDIGCGTGNYTNELFRPTSKFIGIDPSEKMLKKARLLNNQIDWILGSAENIGLNDNSVDGITAFLTIHHWKDLKSGIKELHRVLKPEGRFVLFTSIPIQMEGCWLKHYFPKMIEDSIIQMPSFEKVKRSLKFAGFTTFETEPYFIQPDLKDHFLYCGKHQPKLYLDKNIRNGISSFSDLANQKEIETGLTQLKLDIENNTIQTIIDKHENDLGDYLFIIAKP